MSDIDLSRYSSIINNSGNNNDNRRKKKNHFLLKGIISFLLLFSLYFMSANDQKINDFVKKYVLKENISFVKIKNMYDKYLGGLLPIRRVNKNGVTPVFNEKMEYKDLSLYMDGVKLYVDDFYLVPSLEEGMVVFIGNKDKYGNTIIVEGVDGVKYWYGNISNSSLKLYDYINKGTYIGEGKGFIYLVFTKDNLFLNYDKFI